MSRVEVPAADDGSYWLEVEGSRYPGASDSVRAVVVSQEAGEAARDAARKLGDLLGVNVNKDRKVPEIDQGQQAAIEGINFNHPADERFNSPFSQGANRDGRRPR